MPFWEAPVYEGEKLSSYISCHYVVEWGIKPNHIAAFSVLLFLFGGLLVWFGFIFQFEVIANFSMATWYRGAAL